MTGQLSREEAMRKLREEPEERCPEPIMRTFLRDLCMSKEEFDRYVDMGPRHPQFKPQPNPAFEVARKVVNAALGPLKRALWNTSTTSELSLTTASRQLTTVLGYGRVRTMSMKLLSTSFR